MDLYALPVVHAHLFEWDVTLMLHSLVRAPFESLFEISDRNLTLKLILHLSLTLHT